MMPRYLSLILLAISTGWSLDSILQTKTQADLPVAELPDDLARAFVTEWGLDAQRPWGGLLWRVRGGLPAGAPGVQQVLADVTDGELPVFASVDAAGYARVRWPLHVPFPLRVHLDGGSWPEPGIPIPWCDGEIPRTFWLGEQELPAQVSPTRVRFHLAGLQAPVGVVLSCRLVPAAPRGTAVELSLGEGRGQADLAPGWYTVEPTDPRVGWRFHRLFVPSSSTAVDLPLVLDRSRKLILGAPEKTPVELLLGGPNPKIREWTGFPVASTVDRGLVTLAASEGLLGHRPADQGSPEHWGSSIVFRPARGDVLSFRSLSPTDPGVRTWVIESWDSLEEPPRVLQEQERAHLIPAVGLVEQGSENLRSGEPFDGLLWADGLAAHVRIPGPPAPEPGPWYLHLLVASGEPRAVAVEIDGRPLAVVEIPATGGFAREQAQHVVSDPVWLEGRAQIVLRPRGFMPHVESLVWSRSPDLVWSLEHRDQDGAKVKF